MPIRYAPAAPVAPSVSQAYGAAQQWSQDQQLLQQQQMALARMYEEETARQQQAAQFGLGFQEQQRQFDVGQAERVREFDVEAARRAYEFDTGFERQAQRDQYLAAQELARQQAGQQFQAQRDVFGAGQQERRDVFQAQQEAGRFGAGLMAQERRDVFGAQQRGAEQQAQQQFQMGRDVLGFEQQAARDQFLAQRQQDEMQERFRLQAELQQTELTQAEQMRMQRLQAAVAHVSSDPSLNDGQRADLITQIRTGLDPLQQRQAAAQIRRQDAEEQRLNTVAARQSELMQAEAAYNASTAQQRVQNVRLPDGRRISVLDMGPGRGMHVIDESGLGGARAAGAGAGSAGAGAGGGRAQQIPLGGGSGTSGTGGGGLSTIQLRQQVVESMQNRPGWANLSQGEQEVAIREQINWWIDQNRLDNERLNAPREQVQPSRQQRFQQAQEQFARWDNALRLPAASPADMAQRQQLAGMVREGHALLARYLSTERMPPEASERYEQIVETLGTLLGQADLAPPQVQMPPWATPSWMRGGTGGAPSAPPPPSTMERIGRMQSAGVGPGVSAF